MPRPIGTVHLSPFEASQFAMMFGPAPIDITSLSEWSRPTSLSTFGIGLLMTGQALRRARR